MEVQESKISIAIKLAYERGYRVDDNGNIITRKGKTLIIKGSRTYPSFGASFKGADNALGRRQYRISVHRFAAYCWYGDAIFDKGVEVRHLDGNPRNLSRINISLGTKSDNMMDMPREVRQLRSSTGGGDRRRKKYTPEQIEEIRTLYKMGTKQRVIGEKFGASRVAINRVVNNSTKALYAVG